MKCTQKYTFKLYVTSNYF